MDLTEVSEIVSTELKTEQFFNLNRPPSDYWTRADFDIVLRSTAGTKLNGTNTNSMQFAFNWTVLEDKPYEVSFTYVSETFTTTANTAVGLLTTDLILGNCYEATASSQTAPFSKVLGIIASGLGGTGVSYLFADSTTNEHIYMLGRPKQNVFNIQIFQMDNITLNAGLTTAVDWTMIMHFKDARKR